MGPSTYAKMTEIMSGRTISQLGLTTTSKDPATKVRTEASGGIWSDAWARMSDEGSVTASETTLEVVLHEGNAFGRQRSPGHSVAPRNAARNQTQSWVIAASISERGSMQTKRARGECESALKLRPAGGRHVAGKWRAEPRSEPDSGNPTVRDRRGALRNVTHGEPRNPLRDRKSGNGHSSPTGARAQLLSRHPHARFDERVSGNGARKRTEAPALGESRR